MPIVLLTLVTIHANLYKSSSYSQSFQSFIFIISKPKIFINQQLEKTQLFINSYKKSNYYWISALLGALYGSRKVILFPDHATKLILSIFFIPPVLYFHWYRPWGLECEYRSVDLDSGGVDAHEEENNIAVLSSDKTKLDFIIKTSGLLSEVKIKFKTPNGLSHTIQPYEGDQIGDGKLRIKNPSRTSSVVLTLNKEKDNYRDKPVEVLDLRSGRTLCSVDIVD